MHTELTLLILFLHHTEEFVHGVYVLFAVSSLFSAHFLFFILVLVTSGKFDKLVLLIFSPLIYCSGQLLGGI